MSHPHPELQKPPRLPRNGLRVVGLGGLGEIGRNMTVFEHRGKLLVVDCGVLFPEEHQPGIDVILPDFSWIRDRLDSVVGLVLTHGHEDHIGGVPYLLRERADIPVIGSRLTLALIREKLKEHRITPVLHEVAEGDRKEYDGFDLEFLAVNHSIPDGLAVAIRTAAGTVLHTGDFKMDQFPLDRRITDLRGFARLGEEGVDLFLTDSTNAEVPGFTMSERDLAPAIEQVFRTAPRRIIVSSFASHVHRIQQVLDTAHAHGRKVAFVGRSMVRNMGVAQDLGYLKVPQGLIVPLDQLERLPANKATLVCTGSQGEPMAALARMANRDHKIRVGEGDTILMASSAVPGNENAISGLINNLSRWGAQVVHKGNAKVHVSGHASAGELVYCYNIVKPRNVMPVHGEWRHLKANADLAIATGVPADHVVIAEDGVVVDLVEGQASIVGKVRSGNVYVDAQTVGGATEATLKDRRTLAEEGVVTVLAIVDADTGKLADPPDFLVRGFVHEPNAFDPAVQVIEKTLARAASEGIGDPQQLEQLLSREIGRWAHRAFRRSPLIIPLVIDA
ncbi:ribonuclease J [Nocardioides marmotae]|uniref:Ribonuclease J n=1 Tax=Nocardioides marmotae TaxID=2663857 RepID=A0A6I3JF33_9ACTN|nr:ribonuclease J [Nocardioides marmotae]MCR6033070.1 RNase J family beta-CASP ribonuclease [Gordonia jinghuaiqii]MBC9732569.1 ribonuclease J [Nocardioides marmotae]MTB83688.1 RNase J family beta-CASP ribonuclease [Nocardioides marmotae]MTB96722.1 RNase J family beta-CASP ribonuclease [Nocardioides marmotae]QKE03067.1 ribonuclease J [Nocardioides marmotae]